LASLAGAGYAQSIVVTTGVVFDSIDSVRTGAENGRLKIATETKKKSGIF
jgi:hypothetical protein